MSIRIILADDHTIIRYGLCRSFQQVPDIDVIGQAEDGISTVKLVSKMSPDVVVMDISMPELNGIDAARQIHKDAEDIKIIALSMHSNSRYVKEMFRAGASGYLLKNCQFEELVKAVRIVAEGRTYISPSISDLVVEGFISKCHDEIDSVFSLLSQREREVVQLLTEGKTTKQAARYMHISPKTVEVHRSKIMHKLHIDNIVQLTKYAIQEGLTLAEPSSGYHASVSSEYLASSRCGSGIL